MRSKILSLGMLTLSGLFSGCAMCDNPYDYCGPVVDSGDYHPGGHVASAPETMMPPSQADIQSVPQEEEQAP